MKQPKQLAGYGWKPGQSGNPKGRPIGARQKISEQLLADLATVWETHGASVLERLAMTDPGKLAQIALLNHRSHKCHARANVFVCKMA